MASNSEVEEKFRIEDNILKGSEIALKVNYNSLGQCILSSLDKAPNYVGLHDAETGQKYTFSQMRDMTVRCALWIIKQGIKHGDIVALCSHNHMDTFIPFYATMYTEAIINSWYHDMNEATAEYFMNFIKPKVIFATKSCVSSLVEASKKAQVKTKIITFEKVPGFECIHDIMKEQDDNEVKNFKTLKNDLTSTAVIIFSSGTTGLPKGVELSHGSLLRSVLLLETNVVNMERSLYLWYSSMYWISAVMMRLMIIIRPSTALVHKDYDPDTMCKLIEKYKVTWLFLSTSNFHQLHTSGVYKNYDLSSLKQLMTGGAKLNVKALCDLRAALPKTIVDQAYGMTEMGGLVTSPSQLQPSAVGVVAGNVKIKVLDPDSGKILEPTKIGELCFSSPYMMNGYYLNPEATKSTIDSEGWIHSGDLGYYEDTGHVYIVDRIKEILKVKGHQIAPAEIEEHLRKHPEIADCAVIGVPHIIDNDHPLAFVKKMPKSQITEADVIDLAASLGDIKRLRAGVKFLDKLPHTPSGKIDRKMLREMARKYLKKNECYNT